VSEQINYWRAQMAKHRFSKAICLQVLDKHAARIASAQRFDRGNGTSQLRDGDVSRAVEYGRMKAFEQFAEWIEEGFKFELIDAA
jgi:hypothetical protein